MTAPYVGQCDRIRSNYKGGEDFWQEMMKNRVPLDIDPESFADYCAVDELLDEEETMSDFIVSDPDSGFYESNVEGVKVMFVQTCGFEFIFADDDVYKILGGRLTRGTRPGM